MRGRHHRWGRGFGDDKHCYRRRKRSQVNNPANITNWRSFVSLHRRIPQVLYSCALPVDILSAKSSSHGHPRAKANALDLDSDPDLVGTWRLYKDGLHTTVSLSSNHCPPTLQTRPLPTSLGFDPTPNPPPNRDHPCQRSDHLLPQHPYQAQRPDRRTHSVCALRGLETGSATGETMSRYGQLRRNSGALAVGRRSQGGSRRRE